MLVAALQVAVALQVLHDRPAAHRGKGREHGALRDVVGDDPDPGVVVAGVEAPKGGAEAQVANNVKGGVVEPVAHCL